MSQQQRKQQSKADYVWTNREDYSKNGIHQLGDKLTVKQPEEVEASNVSNLFSKMLKKSIASLIYFNDKTGQMSVYSLPLDISSLKLSPGHLDYNRTYGDNRYYFCPAWGFEKRFGERGLNLYVAAMKQNQRSDGTYAIVYTKRFGERLDNYFATNADEVGISYTLFDQKYADYLDIGLYRESRHNFFSPYQKTEIKKQKILGQGNLNAGRIIHSNLLCFKSSYKWNWFMFNFTVGKDFGNKSYFAEHSTSINGYFQTKNAKIVWEFAVANVWGKNVLTNDLFFQNQRRWTGYRSSNCTSPRIQYHLLKFPYLSKMSINPYFYGQSWGVFSRKQGQNHWKIQAEYGLGISSESGNLKFDICLFQMSTQKFGGEIGNIKFSF